MPSSFYAHDTADDDAHHTAPAAEQWLQKYHPRSLSDIAGHARVIRTLREWLQSMHAYANNASTAGTSPVVAPPPITFLYGAGGIGKTTLARVLLHHANFHIYELNSGEVRSKKRIEEILEKVLNNHSVSMMKKKNRQQTLGIVMDEIDGMSCGDRGGLHELFHIVQQQYDRGVVVNPVICISNRPYDKKLPENLYQEFHIRRPSESDVVARLRTICDAEGVLVDDMALLWVAKYGNQDVRRTVHFLQEVVYYFGNVPGRELTIEDVDTVKGITRHTVADYNLFDVTRAVFAREQPLDTLHDMYRHDPHLILMMLHENLAVQVPQKALPKTGASDEGGDGIHPYTDVLHHLSLANVLSTQGNHWEVSYAMSGITCGVANEQVGRHPTKCSTTKKIQFTNTLTKSATLTHIHHTLTSVSRHFRLHTEHFPRALPLFLAHICSEPEAVVRYGLSIGDVEKLLQVYSKWEAVLPTTKTSEKKGAATKPAVRVTTRLRKQWKTLLAHHA